ncbi:hypothetical protein LTR64_001404 [Lithohypha guttulata]|uniref:Caleosin n=1 Tax=Lithohypha guttulata TaxID=1690604 RepID=A0AAN7YDT2_9EURO|nr:hypothetical protein LTR51_003598 [Lithohypha guttulata]KAK5082104.1 hypothetical protein LTR05_007246 [Lithohypha guttulata]
MAPAHIQVQKVQVNHDHHSTEEEDPPFATYISEYPTTQQRKPYYPPTNSRYHDLGTARVNIAPDADHPNGTTENNYAAKNSHRTVLQQHCDYWDTDHDNIIWPQDTYLGCRRFGWSPPLALIATLLINGNLSYPTCPGFLPDPFFRIYLDKIHKDKHGSDSMTYDNEGRFKPQNFEDIFSKYDRGNKGGLTVGDLLHFHMGQRMVFDFFGWSATFLEWLATYLVIWPEDGIMRKEDVRAVFDGSIFYRKAEETKARKRQTGWPKVIGVKWD